MSFLFPIISSISIAITCGYILYKYFSEEKKTTSKEDSSKEDSSTQESSVEDSSIKPRHHQFEYQPLKQITIAVTPPTLINPIIDPTEYTKIKSNDSDFDIIDDSDFDNNIDNNIDN